MTLDIPPIIIELDFCTILINVNDLMFALILLIIYRRFSRYILQLYNFDKVPKKQNKIAHYIIDAISIIFMGICMVLIISVDSN